MYESNYMNHLIPAGSSHTQEKKSARSWNDEPSLATSSTKPTSESSNANTTTTITLPHLSQHSASAGAGVDIEKHLVRQSQIVEKLAELVFDLSRIVEAQSSDKETTAHACSYRKATMDLLNQQSITQNRLGDSFLELKRKLAASESTKQKFDEKAKRMGHAMSKACFLLKGTGPTMESAPGKRRTREPNVKMQQSEKGALLLSSSTKPAFAEKATARALSSSLQQQLGQLPNESSHSQYPPTVIDFSKRDATDHTSVISEELDLFAMPNDNDLEMERVTL